MTKNVWVQPRTVVQQFMANEYVAACGDLNKVYTFVCDAGWTGISGSTVYTNGPDGIAETGDDVELGSYGKCGLEHKAPATDEFIYGYLRKNALGFPVGEKQDVIIWRGEDGNNIHCTTNLDMDSWETEKS